MTNKCPDVTLASPYEQLLPDPLNLWTEQPAWFMALWSMKSHIRDINTYHIHVDGRGMHVQSQWTDRRFLGSFLWSF